MNIITTLTNYPNQRHQLVLDNNESANFRLYYLARQRAWYFDIVYNDLTINCVKVVLTPNALRQFRKNIPFGITFYTDGYIEPFKDDDFSSSRIKMGILNSDEVKQIEQEVYNR